MLIPRTALVALFAFPLGLSLLALASPELGAYVLWANLAIAGLAVTDGLLGFRSNVTVERECPEVMSLGRKNRVRLVVRTRSALPLSISIQQDGFDHAALTDLPLAATVSRSQPAELHYHVIPRKRGAYVLGRHTVRIATPLWLWWRQRKIAAHSDVRVYPDLKGLSTFELLAREDREHGFLRASRRTGGESEFARLRDYTRDDEYRSIDWKATARRQRLTAREYQLESNQNVCFMLEAGRLMTAESSGTSLFDHALNASLMLSRVAAKNGDRVGLLGFDDNVRAFLQPEGSKGTSTRLIRAVYDLHPRLVDADFDQAFAEFGRRVRKRCLLIVFTQVVDEAAAGALVRHARSLTPRHLPLFVLLRDTDIDDFMMQPSRRALDLYTKAATAELLRWREGLLRDLKGAGALVLDTSPAGLSASLINRYLEIKARQLL
jgi:uncharacterized protein (DUF58 family)